MEGQRSTDKLQKQVRAKEYYLFWLMSFSYHSVKATQELCYYRKLVIIQANEEEKMHK
jgi:hypothetical protein